MFRLTSHTAVPELCFPEAFFLWWRSTTLRWHCFHGRCCDSCLFAFLLPRHLSTGQIYSPAILWDAALLRWDLSCVPMVTRGASASASNCSLSSRSRHPCLGQINSHEWVSGTASRRGPDSPVPCIFCHWAWKGLKGSASPGNFVAFWAMLSLVRPPIPCCRNLSRDISLPLLNSLTWYQTVVAKINTPEWWKLGVNLLLFFLAVAGFQITKQFKLR